MDRDGHWERTEKAYQAIVGDGPIIQNCEDHLKKTYENNFNDEFIEPALVGDKNRAIKDNDSVIFLIIAKTGCARQSALSLMKNSIIFR